MNSSPIRLYEQAINRPLAVEASYARTFFSYLGQRYGAQKLIDIDGNELDAASMKIEAASFERSNKQRPTMYQVVNGIAIIPISGSLVHRLGQLHPYSGMTGYDGVLTKLKNALSDRTIRGIFLDIDSPGGMVNGLFDLADFIYKNRSIKPIWSLAYDMHCSAAQMVASACSHRLGTQTAIAGSVGVITAHTSMEKRLEAQGIEITLITSGKHKADGNPYEKLPKEVLKKKQAEIDALREKFAQRVADYSGIDYQAVMDTEAAVFEGEQAKENGFINEIVAPDEAVAIFSEHLSTLTKQNTGASMTTNTQTANVLAAGGNSQSQQPATDATNQSAASEPADQNSAPTQPVDHASAERERIMSIIGLDEAKGREKAAQTLAANPAIDVNQAKEILASLPEAVASKDETTLSALASAHGEPLSSDEDDTEATSPDDKNVALLTANYVK